MSNLALKNEDRLIAISGEAFPAFLSAFVIAAYYPAANVLLALTDQPRGELEPVMVDGFPATVIAAIEPAIVREWRSFHIVLDGKQSDHAATIALLDPMQLALELDSFAGRVTLGGPSGVPDHLDLTELRMTTQEGVSISADSLADLNEPVLADFDVGREAGLIHQYFPLGDRVLIRRFAMVDLQGPLAAGATSGDLARQILGASARANEAIERTVAFAAKLLASTGRGG